MELENLAEMKNYALDLGMGGESAWSHAAAITTWAARRGLLAGQYQADLQDLDIVAIRQWLNDRFDSSFSDEIFNEDVAEFLEDYYNVDRGPSFIQDFELFVIEDSELLENIDGEVSEDKFDEATLRIVCDEEFAEYFCELLDERFAQWSETVYMVSDNDEHIFECPVMPLETSDSDVTADNAAVATLSNTFNRFAGSCGTFYRRADDDYVVVCDFNYRAAELAGPDNTRPLMVVLSDQLVRDTITLSCPRSATQFLDFSEMEAQNAVAGALREVEPVYEGCRELLDTLFEDNIAFLMENGMSMDEIHGNRIETADSLEEGDNFKFESLWVGDEEFHEPVLLCDLPVDYSWQTLAYVQFTATGERIDQVQLMAIARYFEEEYGACVAAVSEDTIEFALERDIDEDTAKRAAADLFALCPEILSMPGLYPSQEPAEPLAGLDLLAQWLMLNRIWTCTWPCDEAEDGDDQMDGDGEGAFSF